jgi:lipopolysaccharide transport system ATP-binding protein
VSLEVQQGDVVGIIGRNGAGKSTLLKILSRITKPTEGYADLVGRVGSLLEVGTGFHPELTGRENIYLNGAILGMKRGEIERKFDEIVSFAEIEQFLDTPVKHYSSGMYVRLAFSVAAHLEPAILLVDEVLAVGDSAFQKKCLGKMQDVARLGRTVLFVTHNMAAVENLCPESILIERGSIAASGRTETVVAAYNAQINKGLEASVDQDLDWVGDSEIRCVGVRLLDAERNPMSYLGSGQPGFIVLDFEAKKDDLVGVGVAVGIDTLNGTRVLTLWSEFSGQVFRLSAPRGSFLCALPEGLRLRPDIYLLSTYIGNQYRSPHVVINAAHLDIREVDFYGTGRLPDRSQGSLLVPHEWILR